MDDQYQCDFKLKKKHIKNMENGSCSRAPKCLVFFFFRRSTTEHYNLNKTRGVTNMSKAILKQLKGTAFKFLRC